MPRVPHEGSEARRQSLVAWGIGIGVAMVLFCGVGTYMFGAASVFRATYTRNPINGAINDMGPANLAMASFGGIILGLMLIGGTLIYGVLVDRNETKGEAIGIEHARVVARYALTADGVLHTDPDSIEHAEKPKFYVRLALPGRGSIEFRTSPDTFWNCGEGMTGTAEIQGKWLGRFLPYQMPSAHSLAPP